MPPQDRFSAGLDRQSPSARAAGAEDVGFDRSTGQFNAFAGEGDDQLSNIAAAIAERDRRRIAEELEPNALERILGGTLFGLGGGALGMSREPIRLPGGEPAFQISGNPLKGFGNIFGLGPALSATGLNPVALGGKLAKNVSAFTGDVPLGVVTKSDIERGRGERIAERQAGPTGDTQGDEPAPDPAADRTAVREERPDLTQLALALVLARRRGGIA